MRLSDKKISASIYSCLQSCLPATTDYYHNYCYRIMMNILVLLTGPMVTADEMLFQIRKNNTSISKQQSRKPSRVILFFFIYKQYIMYNINTIVQCLQYKFNVAYASIMKHYHPRRILILINTNFGLTSFGIYFHVPIHANALFNKFLPTYRPISYRFL